MTKRRRESISTMLKRASSRVNDRYKINGEKKDRGLPKPITLAKVNFPDVSNPPFACPPDIVVELPFPPSVNKTRKIDWKGRPAHEKWIKDADKLVTLYKRKNSIFKNPIKGPFEAIITLSEYHGHCDADNSVKAVIDFARRLELIVDDSPAYMRRVVVEWGIAPEGCRLVLRPVEG